MAKTKQWGSTIPRILTPESEDRAVQHLITYFREGNYAGASFERLGGGGDRPEVADRITADDLLALAMLSVSVGGFAAREILMRPLADEISDLLRQIPHSATIENEEGRTLLTERDGAASRLWTSVRKAGAAAPQRMRRAQSFGPVRTSKLLARKRPHLFPIYDSVIGREYGADGSLGYWAFLCAQFGSAPHPALDDRPLAERLRDLRRRAGLDQNLSLLRVLDVVIWMDGTDAGSDVDAGETVDINDEDV
ncbi:DUF6308 family protein [Pseudactinotalea terrae]|uniref:DUF6308 family protein n=1 Tax=Pseudactinotalea terrae TaxID=1743262 RepID=UPI0012E0D370|nr:DUF6308 family protein [Pseudactinotalea terrae]